MYFQEPTLDGLKKTVITNLKNRRGDQGRGDAFDGQMLWILWRHIRRTERLNVRIFEFVGSQEQLY